MTAVLLAYCLTGCGGRGAAVTARWNITPMPPIVGAELLVDVRLQDAKGRPVPRAALRLEAHMSHPGMTPVTADVIERSPGAYEARVRLTMAGDWVFVVAGSLPDGSRITRDTRVPGVRDAAPAGPA